MLDVLSLVLAPARAAVIGAFSVELCSTTVPHGSTVQVAIDSQDDSSVDGSTIYHNVIRCLYCLGPAVGLALTPLSVLDVPSAYFIYRIR